jgi:Abortive infection C-terminus
VADSKNEIFGGCAASPDTFDAHGKSKRPVKPLPRHAELALNMAGSMASFLLATFEAKR